MTIDEMIAVLQAAKEGKTIEYRRKDIPNDKWINCACPIWEFHHHEYRIKPTPRMVPLGPEDVPPGSVIKGAEMFNGWQAVLRVDNRGCYLATNMDRIEVVCFKDLLGAYISRDSGKTWARCEKEAKE